MPNLNQVNLMGNLTRDPEVRYTPKGTAVGDIGIAINRRIKVNDEWQDETTFVDVTLWAQSAEFAQKYLTKGASVWVSGRLELDQWEDKQSGQKRQKLKVVADNIQSLAKVEKQEGDNRNQYGGRDRTPQDGYRQGSQAAHQQAKQDGYQPEDDDSDIPF